MRNTETTRFDKSERLKIGIVQFLCFLLIALVLTTIPYTNVAKAQLTDRYEVMATLNPPTTIPVGITIEDLNFTAEYEISSVLMFSTEVNITLNQGLIAHWIEHQPTETSIYDNLGNSFIPIIESTKIESPFINNVTIPAFFEYRITLHFKTLDDVKFGEEISNYAMAYTENQIPVPMTVTFRLPKDYSIFQHTEGANETIDGTYKIFVWKFDQGENVQCVAIFMPFSIAPTVRSMGITIDMETNSPNVGLIETFDMTYDLTGIVMIWNVSLIMPITIPFPANSSNTVVESVSDGQGPCEYHTQPINQTEGSPLGKYFIDYANNVVCVYPRHSYQDSIEKFDVQATFLVPNNSSDENGKPNVQFWQPYRGAASLFFNFSDLPFLHLNMTGTFRVTFLFPSEDEPISSLDGESFVLTSTDNKPTVTFNYNSPISLPKTQWVVFFDNIPLRTFFMNEWLNNVLLFFPVALLAYAVKIRKFESKIAVKEGILEIISLGSLFALVIENIREFLLLNSYPLFIVASLVIEVLLSATMLFLVWKFYKKRKLTQNIVDYHITVSYDKN